MAAVEHRGHVCFRRSTPYGEQPSRKSSTGIDLKDDRCVCICIRVAGVEKQDGGESEASDAGASGGSRGGQRLLPMKAGGGTQPSFSSLLSSTAHHHHYYYHHIIIPRFGRSVRGMAGRSLTASAGPLHRWVRNFC